MEIAPFVVTLGVSLALGLLVGLQREWADKVIAGIRTFALVTVLGAISGMLLEDLGSWVVAAGLVGVTALLILGNGVRLLSPEEEDPSPGITTEVAALTMYLVGVAVGLGHTLPAIVAVLLQWQEVEPATGVPERTAGNPRGRQPDRRGTVERQAEEFDSTWAPREWAIATTGPSGSSRRRCSRPTASAKLWIRKRRSLRQRRSSRSPSASIAHRIVRHSPSCRSRRAGAQSTSSKTKRSAIIPRASRSAACNGRE